MGFRLVPKSVTLNDLERRNSPNLCVISPNSVALRTDYVKVVEDTVRDMGNDQLYSPKGRKTEEKKHKLVHKNLHRSLPEFL